MRKFETTPGGMPIYNTDLEWILDGARDTANAISSGISNAWIISGCEITQTTTQVTITAGLISLNGVIYRVNAQTLPTSTRDLSPAGQTAERANRRGVFFVTSQVTDAGGNRLVNGSNFSPWRVLTAALSFSATNNAYTQGLSGWHISTLQTPSQALSLRVQASVMEYIKSQSVILTDGDIATSNGWVLESGRIEKDFLGRVNIEMVLNGSAATNNEILTLPAGFRPEASSVGFGVKDLGDVAFVIQYPENYTPFLAYSGKMIAGFVAPFPVFFRISMSFNA
jgi:hypothetical protein